MRVLIGCEYSGIVRDEFSKLGHDAWSCDLLPTESELTRAEGKHVQGDVRSLLRDGWDLFIAHPPCTYLSYAGDAHWNKPGRLRERLKALEFFAELYEAPISRICLENPRSCASPAIAKYTQQIQPYYFGDPCLKTTWLWLKNLPKLTYSDENTLFEQKTSVEPKGYWVDSSSNYKMKRFTPSKETRGLRDAKARAKSFPGIARAMAEQWTNYINNL
jgi:hypothetical protein